MIEQYTSPAVVNNSQEPWLVGEGVSLSGSIAIPSLDFNFVTSGLPGTVTFSRASTATYFNSSGVLQSAAINVPRLDYDPSTLAARGLLIEEQRTNSIRNNTMQGAVAGTPGTAPTNWVVSGSGSGITREIVGTGTESGIAYVDIRFSGTPTAGASVTISCESTNQIAATAGQTWTESVFVKLQAGSFVNTLTTVSLLATDGTSGTEAFNSTLITSTPSDLGNCRFSATGTLASGIGTTNVQPRIRIGYTVGVAFDITLRIGLPQLEQGAFATSVIPTTTTALTRNADVASVNTLTPWFNASEGTIFAEASWFGLTSFDYYAAFSDGTASNLLAIGVSSGGAYRFICIVAGSTDVNLNFGAVTPNTVFRHAGAYKINDFATCANAGAVSTDTVGNVPAGITQLSLNASYSTTNQFNGYLRRVVYYPRRLSNAELQSITS